MKHKKTLLSATRKLVKRKTASAHDRSDALEEEINKVRVCVVCDGSSCCLVQKSSADALPSIQLKECKPEFLDAKRCMMLRTICEVSISEVWLGDILWWEIVLNHDRLSHENHLIQILQEARTELQLRRTRMSTENRQFATDMREKIERVLADRRRETEAAAEGIGEIDSASKQAA